jgi:hypothetical protein
MTVREAIEVARAIGILAESALCAWFVQRMVARCGLASPRDLLEIFEAGQGIAHGAMRERARARAEAA